MKPLPSLRQLRYLIAVVEHRHFGRAAEACNMGASTLSAAIQELEALLGARLLERTKRVVTPTALGLAVAERGRGLLREAEALTDLAAEAHDPLAGALTLGLIPTVGPFLIPRIAPALRAAFPGLKLYLREDQTARLLDALRAGTLDGAVIALPWPVEDFRIAEIAEDPFLVAYPPGRTFSPGVEADLAALAGEDLLLLEEGHCLREHALAACALEGARRNIAFQSTSLLTIAQMVAAGLGVTLVPELALNAGLLRGLDIPTQPLGASAPPRRIVLAWRPTSTRQTALRAVAGEIAAAWPCSAD